MKAEKKVSVVILAAGNSGRMAFPKAFLKFDDDYTFLGKIIDAYRKFGCREIIVVLNPEVYKQICETSINNQTNFKIKLVINEHPDLERFHSLKLAIASLGKRDHCFIQNVDNPFVTEELLKQITNSLSGEDYYVPVYKGKGGHPILINEKIIEAISNTDTFEGKLNHFLLQFSRKNIITKDEKILININNINEYNRFFKYAAK